jgi:hypothetical protein
MVDYTWNNPTIGNWNNPFDWSPFTGTVPGAADSATIQGSSPTELVVSSPDSVANLTVDNNNALLAVFGPFGDLAVGNQLTLDAGVVSATAGAELNLNGATNALDGGVLFAGTGGKVNDNNVVFEDGTIVATGAGGSVNIGTDAFWVIQNDDGVFETGASALNNDGTFEKNGGTGTSFVTTFTNNDGEISVESGDLTFTNGVAGTGFATIGNNDQLQFNGPTSQAYIDFDGTDGALSLRDPFQFSGELVGFTTGDTVKLAQSWGFVNESFNGSETTLTLNHFGADQNFQFAGNQLGQLEVHTGFFATTITHV